MSDSTHERTQRGAKLVGAGIVISRVLGVVRQRYFNYYFGLGNEADAYNSALKIPNAVRNLLGEGAISASFIPVYSAALARGEEKGARALANALLGVLMAAVAVLTLIGIAAAPVLARLISPGFADVPGKLELTTRLMRVLFPMTGLMVLSGWCLGIQNAHRRFFMSYASGAMWSIAQIALLIFAGPHEPNIVRLVWLLSWATLAGAALQIAAQLPQVFKLMKSVRPTMDLGAPGLQTTLRNFLPVVGALGLFQISSFIDTTLASLLPTGSASGLQNANSIYLLPLSLFGVATAAASLPQMARDHATGERESLATGVARSWEGVLFYTIPSAVAFIGIGDSIVALLNGTSGKMGPEQILIVRTVLGAYALGLVAYASARLLTSLYQATGNYRRPLVSSATAIAVSASVSLTVVLTMTDKPLAVAGLAFGSAIGAHINLAMLWSGIRGKIGRINFSEPKRVAASTLVVSLIALAAALIVRFGVSAHAQVKAVLVIGTYCAVFLAAARQAKLPEATRILDAASRRFGR